MSDELKGQVAGLAAEIEELRTQLEAAGGGGDQAAQLEQLRGEVAKLTRGLGVLAGQVEEVAGGGEGGSGSGQGDGDKGTPAGGEGDASTSKTPRGAAWVDMTAASAPDYLREVAAWAKLVGPFQAPPLTLYPCWIQHPDVVQKLSDLRTMWLTLYRSSAGGAWMLMDWHLRYWPELQREIYSQLSGCSKNSHKKPFAAERDDVLGSTLEQHAQQWGGNPAGRVKASYSS